MSGMNCDKLHRSTLGIYSSLTEEFNPSLQRLVSLGNSYIQAFQALAATSEAYFSALSKIGEKAFHSMSSRSLGDVLIQISESQRRLILELEGVFRGFTVDVIQQMDGNIKLDRDYLTGSRKRYEMEVHNQAVAMERQLWRGNNQDRGEYLNFLKKSHGEALREEERRHRFLAEKHCDLIQSISYVMNKTGGSLQKRADAWLKEVNSTRALESGQSTSMRSSESLHDVNDYRRDTGGFHINNSKLKESAAEVRYNPVAVDGIKMRMKEDKDFRRNREEPLFSNVPSRAPSPNGTNGTAGELVGGVGRSVRALVAHQPSNSKSNRLPFSKGEMITVLVQQARNGWLYGRTNSTSQQGWFPASYVEAVDDPPNIPSVRSTLRSNSSSSSNSSPLDRPLSRNNSGAQPPPPPPPPPPSNKQPEMQPPMPTLSKGAESNQDIKRSKPQGSRPELFPRGTNPFATVKLRPTTTDDRSSPRFSR